MFVLITAFLLSWLFGLEVAMFLLDMPPDVLRVVYPSALIDKSRRSFFGSSCLAGDPGAKQRPPCIERRTVPFRVSGVA
jgi:hypothetical protein